MTWLKNNLIQIILIVGGVTFGYANFTAKIDSTAQAHLELKKDVEDYKKLTNEKLDTLIRMTERIDERTKRL